MKSSAVQKVPKTHLGSKIGYNLMTNLSDSWYVNCHFTEYVTNVS